MMKEMVKGFLVGVIGSTICIRIIEKLRESKEN